MTVPRVTSFLLTAFSSRVCSFSQHKITQGEGLSEPLDDIKKTLCHSGIIMEGFCFTIPFADLYWLFLDLQDDTLKRSVMVELVTTRETPSDKNRCPFDVLNYSLGTNGHFEAVLPRENELVSSQAVLRV